MGTEYSTGIIDNGIEKDLICKKCQCKFKGRTGVITIKGKSSDPTLCSSCYRKEQSDIMKYINWDKMKMI